MNRATMICKTTSNILSLERKEKDEGREKVFEKKIVKNIPNFMKLNFQIS
jgi:hypothetical protein